MKGSPKLHKNGVWDKLSKQFISMSILIFCYSIHIFGGISHLPMLMELTWDDIGLERPKKKFYNLSKQSIMNKSFTE